MNWTPEQISANNAHVAKKALEAARARIGKQANDNPPRPEIPNAEPEHDTRGALGRSLQTQDSSLPRTILRIKGFRVHPLDPDNFAASTKSLIDGLRKAGLLADDNFWAIKLETDQVKVAHYKDETTEVEIIIP